MKNLLNKIILFFAFLFCFFYPAQAMPEANENNLKTAAFWTPMENNKIRCDLCPRKCLLSQGQEGFCRVRCNIDGVLITKSYGRPVAVHVDPIEKKPFSHVYPGTGSFSIATAGCNLRCKFCQNWEISQADPDKLKTRFVTPDEIVSAAQKTGAKTIAFTYTEPTVFYEYMIEIAEKAAEAGIPSVIHSAGFINEEPLREISKHIIAANIDLKGFSDKFYSSYTGGDLNTVLNSLKILKQEGVWIEITNLLIPGANDSEDDISKLCAWVKENLGHDTPIHFSRFYPMYKLTNLSPTPVSSLIRAMDIAKKIGMKHIYIGNLPQNTGENTFCGNCGNLLVKRIRYKVLDNNIKNSKCPDCGVTVPGIWD
ncbi:MAG: AmmeMemoRadiSam system radical SAM enzyme [Candidatus Omnitrophica bacterium]|nr:AmmeMemoRadiSam system radical SAM enzyme [Candidatus Omnitrophota bacterium]